MKLINYIVILCLLTLFGCNDIDFKENIKYYKNGKIKERFYTDKNQLNQGLGYEYYENGNVKEIRKYFNGKSNGKCLNFYQNGKLKAKGKFSNNVQIDTTFNYFENGQIDAISIYDKKGNDIKDIFFFSSGRIYKVRSYFVDGRGQINAWKEYNANGKLNKKGSNFILIKDLGNNEIKLKFIEKSTYDTIYVKIIKSFDQDKFSPKIIRILKFTDENKVKIKFIKSDYFRGKINIILVKQKWLKDPEKTPFGLNYRRVLESQLQLKKGEKIPKDNLNGIYRNN